MLLLNSFSVQIETVWHLWPTGDQPTQCYSMVKCKIFVHHAPFNFDPINKILMLVYSLTLIIKLTKKHFRSCHKIFCELSLLLSTENRLFLWPLCYIVWALPVWILQISRESNSVYTIVPASLSYWRSSFSHLQNGLLQIVGCKSCLICCAPIACRHDVFLIYIQW